MLDFQHRVMDEHAQMNDRLKAPPVYDAGEPGRAKPELIVRALCAVRAVLMCRTAGRHDGAALARARAAA